MIKTFVSAKKSFKLIKAFFRVHQTVQQLFKQAKHKARILRDSKKQIVDTVENVKQSFGLDRAVVLLGISIQQYYAWKRKLRCTKENPLVCNKRFPNQISIPEIGSIKHYLSLPQFLHWPMVSVYYKMIREGGAVMSLTSFYKYAKLLGLQRNRPRNRRKNNHSGIIATRPGQTLHMDVTIFKTLNNTKVYLYFLVDNFSRFILGWRASLQYSSAITFDLMKEVYEKYRPSQLRLIVELIVDGGPENKGMLDKYINQTKVHINKLIAQKDIVFSNSMVEAVNKQMKYAYLFTKELQDFKQTLGFLKDFAVDDYNKKPHYALFGLTPVEVFYGKLPDKQLLHKQIANARAQRLLKNSNFDCNDCEQIGE
jgi:hypothetical protein